MLVIFGAKDAFKGLLRLCLLSSLAPSEEQQTCVPIRRSVCERGGGGEETAIFSLPSLGEGGGFIPPAQVSRKEGEEVRGGKVTNWLAEEGEGWLGRRRGCRISRLFSVRDPNLANEHKSSNLKRDKKGGEKEGEKEARPFFFFLHVLMYLISRRPRSFGKFCPPSPYSFFSPARLYRRK